MWGFDIASCTWLKNIPIEEFGFYFFGVAVALLLYLWADLVWFGRYHPLGRFGQKVAPPKLALHWPSALIGVALIVAATLYKKLLSSDPCGFPGYFTFLVLVAFIPSSLLFGSVNSKINWHAFSFSALVMFFLSMLWEATIAFPYEWWGYKPHMMIGEFIAAWNCCRSRSRSCGCWCRSRSSSSSRRSTSRSWPAPSAASPSPRRRDVMPASQLVTSRPTPRACS